MRRRLILVLVPDFRSPRTGLYANLARLNLPYAEAVFDIAFFKLNPYPFYVLARELYPGRYKPTISHVFITLLARKGLLEMLFTQNIDCLERAAGVPPEKVTEAHGSFATQRCIKCKIEYPDDLMKQHVDAGKVPICEGADCGGYVKPDIVFFGEPLSDSFARNTELAVNPDLVIIIGTSLKVYPFAALPEIMVKGIPRLLLNMDRAGSLGFRSDDVVELGPCDASIRRLAKEIGWDEELESLWREIVGDEEADRQLGAQIEKDMDLEVELDAISGNLGHALRMDSEEENTKEGRNEDDQQNSRSRKSPIIAIMAAMLGPSISSSILNRQSRGLEINKAQGRKAETTEETGKSSQSMTTNPENMHEDGLGKKDLGQENDTRGGASDIRPNS
jgi:NAD+-dependent protein deacetylase SIR2